MGRKASYLQAFALALALVLPACALRHRAAAFRVVPAKPNYLLRAPDSKLTPFPDLLAEYTDLTSGWVELRPQMALRIENAYFREGAPKRGLANYLGTEVASYRVLSNGALRQVSLKSMPAGRPADQPPVEQLLLPATQRFHRHRYFYQVILNRATGARTAILLSAPSDQQLDVLTKQLLSAPETTCGPASVHCNVFPEACTVSLEMEIVVNGVSQTTLWGNTIANIAAHPQYVGLLRPYRGRLAPVYLDAADPQALRLPLLPGDRLTWR